jgi:ribosomal protein S18 acetylase RimI-like enzyme
LIIRQATWNDIEALVELFDQYRIFYEQESNIGGAKEFLEERLQREESVIFIAYHAQDPVGFTQLYPLFSSVNMHRTWILNDLYVNENVRGKGIGESLLKKAIAYAEETGAKGLSLETGEDNLIAQKLYKKIGFIKETNFFYHYSITTL